MKKLVIILGVVLALLLGVLGVRYLTAPSKAPVSLSVPEPPPAPAPEPEPPLEADEAVYVNGSLLPTVHWDRTRYVAVSELAQALGLEYSIADGEAALGSDATFVRDNYYAFSGGVECYQVHAPFERDGMLYVSVEDLPRSMKLSRYTEPESGEVYLTPGGGKWEIPADHRVPILMYHAVSNEMWGIPELFVDPAEMDRQLAWLVENGYDPIWFEDLRHIEQYDKPVILTFDDGYADNYLELLPLLEKHRVKATFFVIAGVLETSPHSMTPEMVTGAAASGLVSIQSHGMTHHNMGAMDEETLRYEFSESKRILASLTKREPSVVCYPEGKFSSLTLEIAPEYFKFGTKMNGQLYNTSDDPFLAARYYVSRYTTLDEFAAMVQEANG